MDHLYLVVHTHWDREWYQPFQQMRARLVAMADKMLPLVESGAIPSFHFDGQTIVLEDYLEVRPEAERRISKLIRAGKIQVGPWYVLADSFLVSGESLIRNLELGMAQARRYGRSLEVGYLPDQFGHIAQMPQILAGFGFRAAVLWRGVGAEVTRNRFVWEALDGSSVVTIYLPFGYSNGANLPLDSGDALLARAGEIAARERGFAGGAPILVMAGTDHAEPDPRLMQRIGEARGAITFEVGPLEEYIKRLAETPLAGVTTHRGELRSPLRAHLLPSVTSARTWIKQRDFENCGALERFADPLAALAGALGRADGVGAYLDLAWRHEIQNHPHDSICGCSVDQVHTDMRYRFDQAALIAETALRRVASSILDGGEPGEPAVAVFNPTFLRRALVTGEIEFPDQDGRYALEAADGSRAPVVIDIVRGERAFEIEMRAAEFQSIVAGLSQPTVLGRTLNRYQLRAAGPDRFELDLFLSRAAISGLDLEGFRTAIRTGIPAEATIRIHAKNAARGELSFVADGLAQAGFTFYRLVRDDAPPLASIPAPAADSIENEFYSVKPTTRGVEIHDLRIDAAFELYFEDDGDRGDEYNYDPVPASALIASPTSLSARVIENAPLRRRLALELVYEIPAALTADRRARSAEVERLTVELSVTLYTGLERIDFDAKVANLSRDHRLRAALRTPVSVSTALHDTSFGVLRRPLAASEPRGTEDIYPTVPHRSFTAVEGATASAALISRGLYEVEVRPDESGSTILLTLLRCVGWLSRSDLMMRRGGAGPELETPGAQEIGEHRFAFAVTSYRGGYLDAGLAHTAAAYTFAPRVFASRGTRDGGALALGGCDNPRIAFSTARPAGARGAYRFRAFSISPEPERARFRFDRGRSACLIDLAGRRLVRAGIRRGRDGSVELEMRPFEIVTFEVAPKKNSRSNRKKD
ncbi:MAG TPA: glycoside hydrolase family 38 C-terminal domain-containing protein [Candidatus Binataceae bacterium]